MAKQVKEVAPVQLEMAQNGNPQQNNLYISVNTFDVDGHTIGTRIVDMYHFGTRNWLQNHHWWAMHNGHTVECNVATTDEVNDYLSAAKVALANKFGGGIVKAAHALAGGAPAEPEVIAA